MSDSSNSEVVMYNEAVVSVVIPTYNRAGLLGQAVASCALQIWPQVEIIVVDDGSEEDIPACVAWARQKYGLDDRRLRCIRQERHGGSAARNTGFRHSRGEFIQYLDSDDLLHPEKLSVQADHLLRRPELDMVYCLDEYFQHRLGDMRILWNVPIRSTAYDDLDRFLWEDPVWQTGSPLWRRTALERIGGWDERLHCWQDYEFHIKALCAGLHYECSGLVLQYIRDHAGSRSFNAQDQLSREWSCFEAIRLAQSYVQASGRLDSRRRFILRSVLMNHLALIIHLTEPATVQLQREILEFIAVLSSSRQQRLLFSLLGRLAGGLKFHMLHHLFRKQLTPSQPPAALRRLVMAFGDGRYPDNLRRVLDETCGPSESKPQLSRD